MADRLQISDLDFDTIKTNLKNFLKQQSEFTDYDFEGSGLNILLDVLAYNTHYNAYYLNMVANEAFMDTAALRSSVVSHAKMLGYVPFSRRPSVANVNITVTVSSGEPVQYLTLPEGYGLQSNLIDNVSYLFNVLEPITVSRTGNQFIFENIPIYEGEIITTSFTYNKSSNPKSLFILPDENLYTGSLKVTVQPTVGNSSIETYTLATDVLDINSESNVYFLEEGKDQRWQSILVMMLLEKLSMMVQSLE